MANRFDGDVIILGGLTASAMTIPSNSVRDASIPVGAEIQRTKLNLDQEAQYGIPFSLFRVWDALNTNLPGTAASDDLGYITGTFGSAGPSVRTSDLKNTTGTQRARFEFHLPQEYQDGETVKLNILCGMITTVASSSATIDIEVYKVSATDGTIGSDLCATAAQSINSLTAAEKEFEITATGLVAGDKLDIRITIAITDSATGTAVIGCIYKMEALLDVRG